MKAYGRTPWVDATLAREHLLSLLGGRVGYTGGMSLKRIADVSGVSHGSLRKLVYGEHGAPSECVHKDTEQRILSVGPTDAADGATVRAGWTWRMIDELTSLGITPSQIAAAMGRGEDRRGRPPRLRLSRERVRLGTARAVEELHWNVWRNSTELRKACTCPPPRRIASELEPETA